MIQLQQVTKRYGDAVAVDNVSLTIPDGEMTILLGPSGCGKTTLLRTINRMVEVDSGRILIAGTDATSLPPEELRRSMGYAIQSVGLFPHMTVARNIATVPRLLGWEAGRTAARTAELLELVGLDPSYGGKYPHELSGGEAQRIGVARALAADPPVLLMDEPFGALDPINRERLQREFAGLQAQLGKTVVFVTHDIEEAVLLGDRIVLMRDGRIVQEGTPEAMWLEPANDFVRAFFGDEFGLTVLARFTAEEALRTRTGAVPLDTAGAPAVPCTADLRDALAQMVLNGTDVVRVEDGSCVLGALTFTDIVARVRG